jgi:hypothetical protein
MRGSIVKRGTKSFAVVVYLGRDPQTGKEKRKWYSHKRRVVFPVKETLDS